MFDMVRVGMDNYYNLPTLHVDLPRAMCGLGVVHHRGYVDRQSTWWGGYLEKIASSAGFLCVSHVSVIFMRVKEQKRTASNLGLVLSFESRSSCKNDASDDTVVGYRTRCSPRQICRPAILLRDLPESIFPLLVVWASPTAIEGRCYPPTETRYTHSKVRNKSAGLRTTWIGVKLKRQNLYSPDKKKKTRRWKYRIWRRRKERTRHPCQQVDML